MTKKTRTTLFITCLFLFICATPVAVLYSQGYRFNFEEKKFIQTGGIFFKTQPKQAEIYLDGKLKKKTSFIFGSLLVSNLIPNKYEVQVKKEGYHSWQKTLEVKERQVTEAKSIVLFPEDVTLDVLTQGVEKLWFSPDQRKIILKENTQNNWALKLYEIDKDLKSHLIDNRDISTKSSNLLSLEFSEDSKEVTILVELTESIRYFKFSLDTFPPILTQTAPPSPLPQNIITQKEINTDTYALINLGHLYKNQDKLTQTPFPIKQETEYKLEIFRDFIFLLENEDLYQFDKETQSFEKILEGIQYLKMSPDKNRLACFSNQEIWILFLSDVNGGLQKKAGDKVFLIRLSGKIDNPFWLNSHYLIFNMGEVVKITEVDERDRVNIIDIAEIKNPEIFWNKTDKRLYILSEGNLYFSTLPLL